MSWPRRATRITASTSFASGIASATNPGGGPSTTVSSYCDCHERIRSRIASDSSRRVGSAAGGPASSTESFGLGASAWLPFRCRRGGAAELKRLDGAAVDVLALSTVLRPSWLGQAEQRAQLRTAEIGLDEADVAVDPVGRGGREVQRDRRLAAARAGRGDEHRADLPVALEVAQLARQPPERLGVRGSSRSRAVAGLAQARELFGTVASSGSPVSRSISSGAAQPLVELLGAEREREAEQQTREAADDRVADRLRRGRRVRVEPPAARGGRSQDRARRAPRAWSAPFCSAVRCVRVSLRVLISTGRDPLPRRSRPRSAGWRSAGIGSATVFAIRAASSGEPAVAWTPTRFDLPWVAMSTCFLRFCVV